MKEEVKQEIQELIKIYEINCSIREFKDKIRWDYISHREKLSENFIREFKDLVDWWYISAYQNLSENFIYEFKDKVHWGHISAYQNLSENFIYEFKDKLYINYLMDRKLITKQRLGELQKKFEKRNKYKRFEIMDI